VLSHWSVAHHLGLARSAPKQIHVSVPSARRVVEPVGVTVYRTVGAVDASEPWQWPPRTSVDQTVLDIAALGTADDAVAIAALACQRGLTWHEGLRTELERRVGHRWGGVLREALDDIGAGSHSVLEVRFVRDVVRAHGLPVPRLQRTTVAGVHDAAFDEQMVLVELDELALPWRCLGPAERHPTRPAQRGPRMAHSPRGVDRRLAAPVHDGARHRYRLELARMVRHASNVPSTQLRRSPPRSLSRKGDHSPLGSSFHSGPSTLV
jgi:hypothetical protein